MLTVYGVLAVSFMMAMYALERRGRVFIALFALGCVLSSIYGFASGAWPFGVVELVWSAVALRRFERSHAIEPYRVHRPRGIHDGEARLEGGELLGHDPPPHPSASPLTRDQAGRRQLGGVMGDRRLALRQRTLEVAAAGLVLAGDDRQDPEPNRVAEGRKDRCERHGIGLVESMLDEGATAGDLGDVLRWGHGFAPFALTTIDEWSTMTIDDHQ